MIPERPEDPSEGERKRDEQWRTQHGNEPSTSGSGNAAAAAAESNNVNRPSTSNTASGSGAEGSIDDLIDFVNFASAATVASSSSTRRRRGPVGRNPPPPPAISEDGKKYLAEHLKTTQSSSSSRIVNSPKKQETVAVTIRKANLVKNPVISVHTPALTKRNLEGPSASNTVQNLRDDSNKQNSVITVQAPEVATRNREEGPSTSKEVQNLRKRDVSSRQKSIINVHTPKVTRRNPAGPSASNTVQNLRENSSRQHSVITAQAPKVIPRNLAGPSTSNTVQNQTSREHDDNSRPGPSSAAHGVQENVSHFVSSKDVESRHLTFKSIVSNFFLSGNNTQERVTVPNAVSCIDFGKDMLKKPKSLLNLTQYDSDDSSRTSSAGATRRNNEPSTSTIPPPIPPPRPLSPVGADVIDLTLSESDQEFENETDLAIQVSLATVKQEKVENSSVNPSPPSAQPSTSTSLTTSKRAKMCSVTTNTVPESQKTIAPQRPTMCSVATNTVSESPKTVAPQRPIMCSVATNTVSESPKTVAPQRPIMFSVATNTVPESQKTVAPKPVLNNAKTQTSNQVKISVVADASTSTHDLLNSMSRPTYRSVTAHSISSPLELNTTDCTTNNTSLLVVNEEDFPAFQKSGTSDSTSGEFPDPEKPLTEKFESYNRFRNDGENYDIIFEIGPDKVQFPAQLLVLSTYCDQYKDQLKLRRSPGGAFTSQPKPYKVQFLGMEPIGFEKMLNYMYTGNLEAFDVTTTHSIFEAASVIEFKQLRYNCMKQFKENINADNAAKYYQLAIDKNDAIIRDIAVKFIQENTWDVFFSNAFRSLSEEAVKSLLNSNDFYLPEKQIFDAVKGWAVNQPSFKNPDEKESKGKALRKAMGSLLYCIRFPLMNITDFFKFETDNHGLFSSEEVINISKYIALKDNNHGDSDLGISIPPPGFNCTPRKGVKLEPNCQDSACKRDLRASSMSFEEKYEVFAPPTPDRDSSTIIKSDREENMKVENDESSNLSAPDPDEVQIVDVIDTGENEEPEPKKRKIIKKKSAGKPSLTPATSSTASTEKIDTLLHYVRNLRFKEDVQNTEEISETVLLSFPNPSRLFLPKLKTFNLRLVPNRMNQGGKVKTGSMFKQFMRQKSSLLKDILFFDTTRNELPNNSEGTSGTGRRILQELIAQNVDITISIDPSQFCPVKSADVVALKINRGDGILLMHQIKDAQEIINGAGDFPLKSLAVSDCDLTSLEPLRKDLLEVVVMRRVKGLKNHADFFRSCSSLREVIWTDMDQEQLNLPECLFKKNCYSLRKMSLAKCEIVMPSDSTYPENYLEELYLDNCKYKEEFITALPRLFPFVTTIQIYGVKCNDVLLYNILKMRCIKWIFVWEFAYTYITVPTVHEKVTEDGRKRKCSKKKSVLTTNADKIQKFLSGVFDEKVSKQEKITFLLIRNEQSFPNQPGTSSNPSPVKAGNPLNFSCWMGEHYKHPEKFEKVTELDYVHNSYNMFYPTLECYIWSDTSSAKDLQHVMRRTSLNEETVPSTSAETDAKTGSI